MCCLLCCACADTKEFTYTAAGMTIRGGQEEQLQEERRRRTLILFDFDHTLIDVNSDTWILQQISPRLHEHMLRRRRQDGVQWTALMDECIGMALSMERETAESIKNRFRGVQIDSSMKRLLSMASRCESIHVAIVSDANQHYIEWILEWNGLLHCVDEIVTNPSVLLDTTTTMVTTVKDDGDGGGGGGAAAHSSMRVLPLYGRSKEQEHRCDRGCPANMCKADILVQLCRGERFDIAKCPAEALLPLHDERMSDAVVYDSILYCGDGSNDHHPCTILRASVDHVLAREGYSLMKMITSKGEHGSVVANVHSWSTYDELAGLIASLVPDLSCQSGETLRESIV